MPTVYVVSAHAVEQLVARHRSDLSLAEAKELLRVELPGAKLLRQRTFRGDPIWIICGNICVVCKDEPSGRTAVTVLPAYAFQQHQIPGDELELMRDAASRAGPSLLKQVEARDAGRKVVGPQARHYDFKRNKGKRRR